MDAAFLDLRSGLRAGRMPTPQENLLFVEEAGKPVKQQRCNIPAKNISERG